MRTLAAQLVRSLPAPSDLRTDGDLLAGFLKLGSEDDFAELVRRHGPLVWGVCCRMLPDPADAEDAFQATFLVLVRRGRKLTSYPTIGPWLHKVAAWTARNVRRRNARRLSRQSPLSDQVPALGRDPDLALDIDSALLALPEKFRSPIVLCHLLGYSRADAARHLGCAEGTLSAWLSRGLARLRVRLGGLDPTKPLGLAAMTAPGVLTTLVVRAAVASRMAVATSVVSLSVSQVVEGVVRMFWIQKATAMSATVFAVFALGVGVGLSGRQVEGVAEGQEKGAVKGQGSPRSNLGRDADALLREEITDLEGRLILQSEFQRVFTELWQKMNSQIEVDRKSGATPEQLRKAMNSAEDAKRSADDAAKTVQELQKKLDKLKAEKARGVDPDADRIRRRAQLEAERVANQAELTRLREGLKVLPRQIEQSQKALRQIERELEQLGSPKPKEEKPEPKKGEPDLSAQEALEKLVEDYKLWEKKMREGQAIEDTLRHLKNSRGHLELAVTPATLGYQFALKEVNADGKEVGTLVVEDSPHKEKMLAILLARTKADPLAPRTLRVVASPPTASGTGALAALKACDAAGYRTVTFTGYVISGGFARNLKPNETGEVPGYSHYDGVERTPASLIQEIEKGRVSY